MDRLCAMGWVCLMAVLGLSCKERGSSDVARAGAADSSPSASESTPRDGCPPPSDLVAIDLGCPPSAEPVVKTTGPCTLTSGSDSESVYLQTNGAGTCHVELTLGTEATSVDVNVVSRWRPLGSDPHGCGQEFFGVTESGSPCLPSACKFPLPERRCDAGR